MSQTLSESSFNDLLGGSRHLQALADPRRPLSTKARDRDVIRQNGSGKQVWPDIPRIYEHCPKEMEATVREISYITQILRETLLSGIPLPADTAPLSDLLLSLETRHDITHLTLLHSSTKDDLSLLAAANHSIITNGGDADYRIIKRAAALAQYWTILSDDFTRSLAPWDDTSDEPFEPLVIRPPAGKPRGWKLRLSAEQEEESRRVWAACCLRREHALLYFRVCRPVPVSWTPLMRKGEVRASNRTIGYHGAGGLDADGDGDDALYWSRDWMPVYRSWERQVLEVPVGWRHPGWGEEEEVRALEGAVGVCSGWVAGLAGASGPVC